MNRLWPSQIILTNRYSNVTGSGTIAQQITAIATQITAKQGLRNIAATKLSNEQGALTSLQQFYDYDDKYYTQYADANNWDAAYFHSNRRDNETAPQIAAKKVLVDAIKEDIRILDEEITALNNQRTALLTAQLNDANLTPAQRLAAEKQKAEADRLAKELDSKSKNKKIIVIASAIIGVIGVIGLIIYIIKKRKGAKVASA